MTTLNWYVLYTKPKYELKVANLLTRKQIKNFCPVRNVESQLSDSKKNLPEPLFTSFVFVCIEESETASVLKTPGALNYLYWLNKPVIISEEEIGSLVTLSNDYENLKPERCLIQHHKINGHDSYKCVMPEFATSENEIKVMLPSIGYYVIASAELT